jgi:hypothetical protein
MSFSLYLSHIAPAAISLSRAMFPIHIRKLLLWAQERSAHSQRGASSGGCASRPRQLPPAFLNRACLLQPPPGSRLPPPRLPRHHRNPQERRGAARRWPLAWAVSSTARRNRESMRSAPDERVELGMPRECNYRRGCGRLLLGFGFNVREAAALSRARRLRRASHARRLLAEASPLSRAHPHGCHGLAKEEGRRGLLGDAPRIWRTVALPYLPCTQIRSQRLSGMSGLSDDAILTTSGFRGNLKLDDPRGRATPESVSQRLLLRHAPVVEFLLRAPAPDRGSFTSRRPLLGGLLFLSTIHIQIHTHLKWGGYG